MRESVLRMVVVVTEVTTAMSEEWGVRESVLRMVARASKLVSGKVEYEDTMYIMNTNWKRARSTTLCVRRRGVQQRMIFLVAVRITAVQSERACTSQWHADWQPFARSQLAPLRVPKNSLPLIDCF